MRKAAVLLLVVLLSACQGPAFVPAHESNPPGPSTGTANPFVGSWRNSAEARDTFTFRADLTYDRTFVSNGNVIPDSGTYSYTETVLSLTVAGSTSPVDLQYSFNADHDALVLSNPVTGAVATFLLF